MNPQPTKGELVMVRSFLVSGRSRYMQGERLPRGLLPLARLRLCLSPLIGFALFTRRELVSLAIA